jgi:tRNA (guanine37-N1)-methyltransferase
MRIDVFTIFPDLVRPVVSTALIGKAVAQELIEVRIHDIRDYATGVHRATDDAPFGGGAGMVMSAEPIMASIEAAQPPRPLLSLGPTGTRFDQARARELADSAGFSLLCGRYEGIDQRVIDAACDGEISIGDYVLNGGETAATVVIEAVGRLVPGVMGNLASAEDESFSAGLLEYPHFTRPATWRGRAVPQVLLSGDHAKVARWRLAHAVLTTARHRPDLLVERGGISRDEAAAVHEFFDLNAEPDGDLLRTRLLAAEGGP